jgi:membrane-bound serine protease (ClpP class)
MFYSAHKKARRGAIVSNELGLSITTNPNVALLLLAAGVAGICAELCSPGRIAPGAVGAVLAMLGIASLAALPVSWPGVALMVLAMVLLAFEARFLSRGLFTLAGAAAMFLGSRMLVYTPDPALRIHWYVAAVVALPLSIAASYLLSVAVRARRNKAAGCQGYIPDERQENELQS